MTGDEFQSLIKKNYFSGWVAEESKVHTQFLQIFQTETLQSTSWDLEV